MRRLEVDAPRPESTSSDAAQDGSSVAQHSGVDLGGPATFDAAVLERLPDGELRPLATFDGADAEQQAQAFVESLPFSVDPVVRLQKPADDGRWLPGAMWELKTELRPLAARLAVETATPGSEYVWLAGRPGGTHVLRRSDMTEANGWRFIGREATMASATRE